MGLKNITFFKTSPFIIILLYLFSSWFGADSMPICDFSKIKIISKYGPLIYHVEIADTHERRQKGLMYRKHLASGHGMFFIFEKEKYVSMWMKNTEIPLDIIFINENGVITQIVRNATPMNEKVYYSDVKVKYVLEISSNGEDASVIGIGNSIVHCSLGQSK